MPAQFKNEDDRVGSYRRYINETKGYAVWRYTEPPSWWDAELHAPVREEYENQRALKRLKKVKDEHPRVPATLQSERGV
jgi:hypothetical protein